MIAVARGDLVARARDHRTLVVRARHHAALRHVLGVLDPLLDVAVAVRSGALGADQRGDVREQLIAFRLARCCRGRGSERPRLRVRVLRGREIATARDQDEKQRLHTFDVSV